MALAEDASSPASISQTNNSSKTVTTATFSPPANSLLVVMFTFEAFNSGGISSITVTDSLGSTYSKYRTLSSNGGGASLVAYTYLPTAHSNMTVTGSVTGTPGTPYQKVFTVKVVTGADPTQGAGNWNTWQSQTDASLQAGYGGSYIYGTAGNWNNDTLTATGSTTTFTNAVDGSTLSSASTFRSTSTTTSGNSYDIGVTGGTDHMQLVLYEVISAIPTVTSDPTLKEDSSTPRIVHTTSQSATTSSFTPPSNSLVVAMATYEAAQVGCTGLTITDSTSAFYQPAANSPIQARNSSGYATLGYTYYVNSPGSITVTATGVGGTAPYDTVLAVRVLTGAASAQVSGYKVVGQTTQTGMNVSQTGSYIYGICADDLRSSLNAINGNTTILSNSQYGSSGSSTAVWRSTNTTTQTGFAGNSYGMKGGYGADVLAAMEVVNNLDFSSSQVGQMYPILIGQRITANGQTSGFKIPSIKPLPTGYALPAPGVQPPPVPAQNFAVLVSTGPAQGSSSNGVPLGIKFEIQWSYDNTTWSIPDMTGVPIYDFPLLAGNMNIGRLVPAAAPWYRVTWTVQGSSPVFNATIYVVPAL